MEARYRRAAAELAVLAGRAADPGGRRIAEFLSGDALVLARMASATAVLQAAGLSVSPGATRVDCLQAAVAWLRYARGRCPTCTGPVAPTLPGCTAAVGTSP